MNAIDLANEIRKLKIDSEDIIDMHYHAKMRFFVSSPEYRHQKECEHYFAENSVLPKLSSIINDKSWTEIYENISYTVDSIRSSYVAPCLHLNNYLEWSAIDIEWEEKKFLIQKNDYHPRGDRNKLEYSGIK